MEGTVRTPQGGGKRRIEAWGAVMKEAPTHFSKASLVAWPKR